MLKSYKYRIYPNNHQKQKIDDHINACRFIYNLALETKISAYRSNKNKNISAYDLMNQLPDLKKEYVWLKNINAQSLQQSIKNMDCAYKNFFNRSGFPKFKSKRHYGSYLCPQNNNVDFYNSKIFVRKFKEGIRFKADRLFNGVVKSISISKTKTDKYFASVLVDNGLPIPDKKPVKNAIGIDLGIKYLAITSDGEVFENQRKLKSSLDRLKVLQRRASRKVKGSNNRRKANLRVAKKHEEIKNKRLDYIHKVTSRLVNDNQVDTFFMEDLNVKGMMSNHKLAQAISDVSWHEFIRQMKYKCGWSGKNFIRIDRFAPSSKTCSSCGSKKDLKLSDRTYSCENCGEVIDRDLNAAINIKNFGLSGQELPVEPVESPTSVGAMKQELFFK